MEVFIKLTKCCPYLKTEDSIWINVKHIVTFGAHNAGDKNNSYVILTSASSEDNSVMVLETVESILRTMRGLGTPESRVVLYNYSH